MLIPGPNRTLATAIVHNSSSRSGSGAWAILVGICPENRADNRGITGTRSQAPAGAGMIVYPRAVGKSREARKRVVRTAAPILGYVAVEDRVDDKTATFLIQQPAAGGVEPVFGAIAQKQALTDDRLRSYAEYPTTAQRLVVDKHTGCKRRVAG